jgi:hypothetical protein
MKSMKTFQMLRWFLAEVFEARLPPVLGTLGCDGLPCLVYPFMYLCQTLFICFFGAVIFITV